MRGIVKLHIYHKFKTSRRFFSRIDLTGIMDKWKEDFKLSQKPHYITVIPVVDDESTQNEISGFREQQGSEDQSTGYCSLEKTREKEAAFAATQGTLSAGAVDVGATGGLVTHHGNGGSR